MDQSLNAPTTGDGKPAADSDGWPTVAEVEAIAEQGFIYGLPLVMSYLLMNAYSVNRDSGAFTAPFNEIDNRATVYTDKDVAIPLPNSDTPYSVMFMDLRAEPLVLSLPAVGADRYYSVMLSDGNTYNYGYMGTRTTGNSPGHYLVAGPSWDGPTPEGIAEVFRSGSQFSLAAYRTQLIDKDDMPNVVDVQAGYHVQPLSEFLHQPPPPAAPVIDFPPINPELMKTNFFAYLDFVLPFVAPQAEEVPIRADLARIGIGPDKTRSLAELPDDLKAAVLRGAQTAGAKVEAATKNFGVEVNGWNVAEIFGDRAFYGGDWLARAAAAKFGIFGNSAQEALYPLTTVDSTGDTLDASAHNYTLTFQAGELPPVGAFWSLTMYDPATQHLVTNPINRFLVNSAMLRDMTLNADGSLSLRIQHDSPGDEWEANWLPAPDGPIYLLLRLYVPNTTGPSILPAGHGTWQPPPVTRAA